eukprot:m.192365 g.192365  ORF g.192365 m.192365 type:complete len:745 (+) comp18623_c0_seq1:220-2454(+)
MAGRHRLKRAPQVHSAFADDDDEEEGTRPKLRLPASASAGASASSASATSSGTSHASGGTHGSSAASTAPASSSSTSSTKPVKKAARDFTNLLSQTPTYTKWSDTAQAEAPVDADATVVDAMDMAQMMGFSGFGGAARQADEKKASEDRTRKMLAATRRDGSAKDSATEATTATDAMATTSTDKGAAAGEADAEEGDNDDMDDDEEGVIEAKDSIGVPISHEVIIKHGAKPVSAMDLDAAGGRLITGGYDYKVRLWDFATMDARMRSFKQIEPAEGVQVRQLAFSKTGDLALLCTGNAMPKVLDRDGFDVAQCLKGDQYFNDLSKTYGHVSIVTDAVWHPTNKKLFITASADSTVRVWNTDHTQLNNTLKSSVCGKCRAKQGKRALLSSLAVSHDGKLLAAGSEGGGIYTFVLGDKHMIPKAQHHTAHADDSTITSVKFARNGKLLSRGTDGVVAMWSDPRRLSGKPDVKRDDLPCYYPMTDAVFSPDEKLVLTGMSGPDVEGMLVMMDVETLETKHRLALGGPGEGIIRIRWHPRINQIAVSMSTGQVRVLFDDTRSVRGAKMCVAKAPRKANVLDAIGIASFGSVEGAILAPHTHKAFQTEEDGRRQSNKRKSEKARKDPIKSRLPEKPIAPSGPFKLGYQGQVRNYPTSINQFLASKTSYDKTRDEDPREAILRHAEEAAKNPQFVDTAYTMMNNRVDPILNTDYNSDEDEQAQGSLHKRQKVFDPMKKPFQVKGKSAQDM